MICSDHVLEEHTYTHVYQASTAQTETIRTAGRRHVDKPDRVNTEDHYTEAHILTCFEALHLLVHILHVQSPTYSAPVTSI